MKRTWPRASVAALNNKPALDFDGTVCPGVRVAWTNTIAFLAEGKDGAFNDKLEAMAGALAKMLSATWYRWQVRLV